jgi:hypothetical protein
MKLTCPYCGNKYSIAEATRTETLVNLTQALAGFGQWCPLVWEYTGAFATQRLGSIAPAKRLRIVTDLGRLWETGVFQVENKRYRTTRADIVAGMRTVCDLEKYGFRNHNYLKRILLQRAERISAEGLTATEEKRREEDRKGGCQVSGVRCQDIEETTMTPEAQAEFKKKLGVGRFSELIGRDRK